MRSKSKSRKWTCRFSLPIVKGVSQYGSNQGQLPHKANAPASLLLIEMSKHRLRLQSLQFLQRAKNFSSFYCNQCDFASSQEDNLKTVSKHRLKLQDLVQDSGACQKHFICLLLTMCKIFSERNTSICALFGPLGWQSM